MLDLDARAGLADGYSARLLCGDKGFGQLSLSLMLQALKCQLMLVPEGAEPAGASSENSIVFKSVKDCALAERRSHWAKLGGHKRRSLATVAERREMASKGGKASAAKRARRDKYFRNFGDRWGGKGRVDKGNDTYLPSVSREDHKQHNTPIAPGDQFTGWRNGNTVESVDRSQ
jgi:hypothetical protein